MEICIKKAKSVFKNLKHLIPLIFILVLEVLVISFALFGPIFNSESKIEPTPAPTQTPNPKSTPTINIFGGDLQGNSIKWNTMYIGESENVSFYVQNPSNVPVTLSYLVTDWSPPGINSFLSLSWDYNSLPINPNQTILLTITLTSPLSEDFANYLIINNVTTFSFNLHITATKS